MGRNNAGRPFLASIRMATQRNSSSAQRARQVRWAPGRACDGRCAGWGPQRFPGPTHAAPANRERYFAIRAPEELNCRRVGELRHQGAPHLHTPDFLISVAATVSTAKLLDTEWFLVSPFGVSTINLPLLSSVPSSRIQQQVPKSGKASKQSRSEPREAAGVKQHRHVHLADRTGPRSRSWLRRGPALARYKRLSALLLNTPLNASPNPGQEA